MTVIAPGNAARVLISSNQFFFWVCWQPTNFMKKITSACRIRTQVLSVQRRTVPLNLSPKISPHKCLKTFFLLSFCLNFFLGKAASVSSMTSRSFKSFKQTRLLKKIFLKQEKFFFLSGNGVTPILVRRKLSMVGRDARNGRRPKRRKSESAISARNIFRGFWPDT